MSEKWQFSYLQYDFARAHCSQILKIKKLYEAVWKYRIGAIYAKASKACCHKRWEDDGAGINVNSKLYPPVVWI